MTSYISTASLDRFHNLCRCLDSCIATAEGVSSLAAKIIEDKEMLRCAIIDYTLIVCAFRYYRDTLMSEEPDMFNITTQAIYTMIEANKLDIV